MGAAFRTEQIDALRSAAEPAGYAVRILDLGTEYAPDTLEDCEILCGHCPEELLRNAKKLRWIQLTSAGVDRMADPSIYPHEGVVVTNATGVFGISIAEHLIMGTLMLLRKMPH
jgi:phosphoglycerate dehydrogenase-like enzyme